MCFLQWKKFLFLLKQCAVSLQRYYAGCKVDSPAPVSVSLTRSGIPRLIPCRLRHCLRKGDDRSDYIFRLYLSWFNLSRVIVLAKPVTKSTFESITKPVQCPESVAEVRSLMKIHFKEICRQYIPWISTIPLSKGLVWEPTWKATPNDDRIFVGLSRLEEGCT